MGPESSPIARSRSSLLLSRSRCLVGEEDEEGCSKREEEEEEEGAGRRECWFDEEADGCDER